MEDRELLVVRVQPETPQSRVTLDYRGRNIAVHSLLETEIRDIGSLQNSANLAFFMLTGGLAVGFGTNLLLSHETMTDRVFMLFGSLFAAFIVMTIYFGVRAIGDWRQAKARVNDIINQGSTPKIPARLPEASQYLQQTKDAQ